MRKQLSKIHLRIKSGLLLIPFFCMAFLSHSFATIYTITAQGMTFTPNSQNCKVGDTIKFQWVNGTHTTTSVSVPAGAATWNQNLNSGSQTYKYVITKAGTYNYHCNFHYTMGMTGVLNATAPLTATISPFANISCTGSNNGNATASPAGGTSPYTYSWSPGGQTTATISSLTAGTYTVTVTDAAAATATASVTITQPASLPAISIASHVNVDCHGNSTGSATANTATGGTTPYTYAWTPSGGNSLTASNLSANTYTITVTDNNGCTATASVIISQPATSPGITMNTHTNINCNGNATGSATANAATGGTTPYTYAWTPTGGSNLIASGLTAGTYTITATDNHGCAATASANITQPTALGISIASQTNVNCSGNSTGSATANTASGGVSPYTYAWTPSGGNSLTASNLTSGTYTITVTDHNSCTASASVSITEPASALGITIATHTDVSCTGGTGSATANTATGGTSPYTYAWTPSGGNALTASNITAGTYTITVTDNHNCSASASVSITQPASALDITIAGHTDIRCNGNNTGSAAANAATGGTSPYTYTWAPSGGTNLFISSLSANSYTITATDNNGCAATAFVTVNQPNPLSEITATTANAPCNNNNNGSGNITASGGTLPYTYSWSNGNTTSSISGLSGGTYSVTIQDNCGVSFTDNIVVTQPAILGGGATTNSNVTCNGLSNGSATASASDGTLPYTYSWSNGSSTVSTSPSPSNLSAGNYTVTLTDNCGENVTASISITEPLALGITTTVTPVTCAGGGTATANVSGGTSPYTYLWSDASSQTSAIAIGLAAGPYTVTVTDFNNCSSTAAVSITITSGVSVTANAISNVNCFGGSNGSAVANVSGGTTPYTYLWSDGNSQTTVLASGLSVGTYSVNVTDNNGCTGSATVGISQPAQLTVNAGTIVNVSCNGGNNGSAFSVPSGGTAPYTYQWSPGGTTNATIAGLTEGTYTITVMDSCGNSATASTIITQPNQLNVIANVISNVTCNGFGNGSASSTVSGGTLPYTYSWSDGETIANANGLSAGTYTLTVSDSCGGSATSTGMITQPAVLTTTHDSVSDNGSCNGIAVLIGSGGTSPYTYFWVTGSQTTDSITSQCAGTYCCVITDNNHCVFTDCVTVKLTTGMNQVKGKSEKLIVYPNPNNGIFKIQIVNGELSIVNCKIQIYNILGEVIYSNPFTINNSEFTLNIDQPNGVYLCRVLNGDGSLMGETKLVIQK